MWTGRPFRRQEPIVGTIPLALGSIAAFVVGFWITVRFFGGWGQPLGVYDFYYYAREVGLALIAAGGAGLTEVVGRLQAGLGTRDRSRDR